MEKPKKIDLVILCLTVTAFTIAKDLRPSVYKSFGSYLVFLLEFSIVLFLSDHMSITFTMFMLILAACIFLEVVIKYVYRDQIDTMIQNYATYYSIYIYALFVVLLLAGTGYVFNSMIGGNITKRFS